MKKLVYKKKFIISNVVYALILAVVIAVNCVAVYFGTALDLYFGTIGGQGTQSESYTSDYSSAEDLVAAQEDFAERVVGGGAVLLKNEDAALPLSTGAAVTLFGSEQWYNTGSGSGSVANEAYADLTVASVLADAGFSVNPDNTSYDGYQDAAIFILSRTGGEGTDATLTDTEAASYLALTDSDRQTLETIAAAGFDKTIVILNTCNAVNMDFLDQQEYGIDACLWAGATGSSGITALGDLLNGTVNPSGHLTDTYLYDNLDNPAMQNFGEYYYDGTEIPYVNYIEGIYIGYKYFETRYEDVVMGTTNAGDYDYDSVVYRPFGFGLSYTEFEWSDYSFADNGDGTGTVKVTVTNTGDAAGRDVVEVYYQAPYTDYDKENNVEKASVNLAEFAKTDLLEAGESQTVEVTFDLEKTMKSYDSKGARTYIMDDGDYYITAAQDAHEAVDNILAAKGYDQADGNADMTGVYSVPEFLTLDTDSTTGAEITNLFDDAEALDAEYLSRQDWSRVEEGLTYTADGTNIENLSAYYNRSGWAAAGRPSEADSTDEFTTGADNGLTLADMTGLSYDDPQWEQLLDEMSITEMHDLMKRAGYTTEAVPSIEKERTYDFDGPAGIVNFVSGWSSFGYPTETLLASTWDRSLAEEMGRLVGEDGLRADIQGWYAPAMNIHRAALGGRNYEYYSEDSLLSGIMGAAEVTGARSKGLAVYIKHFVINDQETNRSTTITWTNEQALREIYLKPFEITIKTGNATGLMGSMNRIGYRMTVGSYALMTSLLREEWGFRGAVITDYTTYDSADADQMLAAGTNLVLQTSEVPLSRTNSWTRRNALRESAHEVLYMSANSIAVDAGSSGFSIYILILIALDAVTVIGLGISEFFAVKRAIHGEPDLTPQQRKKRRMIKVTAVVIVLAVIAGVAIYFIQYYLAHQL